MLDVIVTYALFAGGITANKYVLHFFSPIFAVGMRMFCAGSLLLAYQAITNRTGLHRMIRTFFAHDLLSIGAIMFCTTFIPSLLKSFVLHNLPASKATLLGSIDPFVTALFAYFIWNERLNSTKICGILLGCASLVISIISKAPEEANWEIFGYISYPEIAQICAVIIGRYGWILVQRILRTERYSPAGLNSLVMFMSGTFSLILAYITGGWGFTHMPEQTMHFWSILLFTIFFGNVVGYTLYGWCLKRHNTTFMALAGFLVPLLVACMSNILLGESITISFAGSALLLFTGLAVFYSSEIRASKVH